LWLFGPRNDTEFPLALLIFWKERERAWERKIFLGFNKSGNNVFGVRIRSLGKGQNIIIIPF
jgi:hypothetical protein